ncbi:hypothetical protein SAMN06272735_2541 [Streptomyces sp. TLI_55]|uniref:hypothetical protein n=1 Tax=Streptomyces sp. TLI_55 TaxID=1938861 RepID=UPI000BD2AA2A|nr:hypothetical protein [Streptomyces sp. TLI_55]SNX58061.1 hypothetical protein SAMN06272735_2541 [Streptomyces sp. TLI_55]
MDLERYPWSSESSGMGHLVAYQRAEAALRLRHPELSDRIEMHSPLSALPTMLSVRLPDDRRVLLWLTRFARPRDFYPFWLIVGPDDTGLPRMWDALTSPDVLADAVRERVRAFEEHRVEASPWRWDEPDRQTSIIRLADTLAESSFDVRLVVSGNRIRATQTADGVEAFPFREHEGDFVEFKVGHHSVRISRKKEIGWLADVHEPELDVQWRIDLHWLLDKEAGSFPGYADDDQVLGRLHHVIEPAIWDRPPKNVVNSPARKGDRPRMAADRDRSEPLSPQQAQQVTMRELLALGFTDVTTEADAESASLASETLYIASTARSRPLGLADVKQLYADASIAKKRLMVLLRTGGMTRPAAEFANRAGAFVFWADRRTGLLAPYNGLAREVAFSEV